MAASRGTNWRKFLLHFANEHLDFRLAELRALSKLFKAEVSFSEDQYDLRCPFLAVELESEEKLRNILSRSVLIRSAYELWAEGATHTQLHDRLRLLPSALVSPHLGEDVSFRIQVEGFNKSLKQEEKLQRIEELPSEVLAFRGKVRLKCPDQSFHLLEFYGHEGSLPSPQPLSLYFARWIGDGQRNLINHFHLQKRKFIGNTSMDAGLSLLMSNLGLVSHNAVVLDPFVGTGSLLVACAHHGAYVMGTDIDFLLLHGLAKPSRCKQKKRERDESIAANLRQYGLESRYLDILVSDAARLPRMLRPQQLYDAIITDPPYGIREQTKKLGTNKSQVQIDDIHKNGHIPQRVDYQLSDIFLDLLNLAASFLVLHGHLVFWLPVYRPEYTEKNLPCHPALSLVANCEQVLNTKVSRRLIVMQKSANLEDLEDGAHASFPVDHFQDATFRERYFSSLESPSLSRKSDT